MWWAMFWQQPLLWIGVGVVLAGGGALVWAWLLRHRPRLASLERARKLFHLQRERLEHRFFMLASRSGNPRGLEWVDCEFEDDVAFARDRHTGRLRALVAVAIRFRAIEGGGMEDNPNVGNLRAASAIFYLDGEDWSADGKAYMNLSPAETIDRYRQELEVVE